MYLFEYKLKQADSDQTDPLAVQSKYRKKKQRGIQNLVCLNNLIKVHIELND